MVVVVVETRERERNIQFVMSTTEGTAGRDTLLYVTLDVGQGWGTCVQLQENNSHPNFSSFPSTTAYVVVAVLVYERRIESCRNLLSVRCLSVYRYARERETTTTTRETRFKRPPRTATTG